MLVATTEQVAGSSREAEPRPGVVVHGRGLGGNLAAGLRKVVGGEIKEYAQLLEEARRHAVDRLVESATPTSANGVIMMRLDAPEIGQSMSEIVAFGTAVISEPVNS